MNKIKLEFTKEELKVLLVWGDRCDELIGNKKCHVPMLLGKPELCRELKEKLFNELIKLEPNFKIEKEEEKRKYIG